MTAYPSPTLYPSTTAYPDTGVAPSFDPGTSLPTTASDLYRLAIRSGSVNLTYLVDASLKGVPIAGAQGLRPTGGAITDTSKPGVRRSLSLDLAPQPGLFDLLSPIGTTLTVTCRIEYQDRTTLDLPMGVFEVDSESFTEGAGGLSLTAPDKWVRIQRAKFIQPQSSTKGLPVLGQIVALIRGALGAGTVVNVTATSTAKVGSLTWEKDRDTAILDLAEGIGVWVFFDRTGIPTIADVPTTGKSADWLIDASASGVLTGLKRERSRTSTFNVVVVESSASDAAAFPTQVVFDMDPSSPTYAGTNPLTSPGSAGAFGVVPYFYDTPLPLTAAQAFKAGATILARTAGLASQVSLGSTPNPAVDAFHVIDVLPPRERYDVARVLERHIVDTVAHPLTVEGEQSIDGRSTRTDEYT